MASSTDPRHTIQLQPGIVLGPYQVQKDIPRIVIHMNDKTITKNFESIMPDPYTPEDAVEWLNKDDVKLRCSIRSLEKGDILIGDATIHSGNSLGYWLSPEFWNKGIMSRAVAEVICEAKAAGLEKIKADVFTFNPSSRKVLIHNGFRYIGDGVDDNKKLPMWKFEHD